MNSINIQKLQRKLVCVFPSDLFEFYNETILRELMSYQNLLLAVSFLTKLHIQLTVLIADIKKKLQELLQNLVKENEKG